VFWDGNNINGADWMPNSPLTITIDADADPTSVLFTYEAFTDEVGDFEVGGDLAFDIKAGHYVVATDGTSTKDHWVTTMMFADADPDTDIVTGTAGPGSVVVVEPDVPLLAWEHINFQFGPGNRNPESLNEHLAFRRALAHAVDRDAIAAVVPGAGFAIDSHVDAFLPDLSQHAAQNWWRVNRYGNGR
jgi:hypothetical protein